MIVWSLLCAGSAIDNTSNNISLFNVLEQLAVSYEANGHLLPIRFEHVSTWQRDDPAVPETYPAWLTILSPDGETLGKIEFDVDLSDSERARIRHQFAQFQIRGEGRYQFELSADKGEGEHVLHRVPLAVSFDPASGDEPATLE